jgi:hypothetical protein
MAADDDKFPPPEKLHAKQGSTRRAVLPAVALTLSAPMLCLAQPGGSPSRD